MSRVYYPGDIFRATGRHWALDDDFSYPMDPGQHNSHAVMVKMNEEWQYRLRQSQALREEAIELNIRVPKARAIGMTRCNMDEIRNALYRIREENNRIMIRLNRHFFTRRTRELLEDGDARQASLYNSFINSKEHESDIEISDEET